MAPDQGARRPEGPGPGERPSASRPAGSLRWAVLVVGGGLATQLAGCGRTSPSALDPHGPGAHRVARLWWLLFWISAVVFAVVTVLVLVALLRRRGDRDTLVRRGGGEALIVIGGLDRGALVWREPEDANAHLEIIVRDRGDGRFVPGLSVWVMLIDDEGHEVGDRVHPMVWHLLAYHCGRNWRVPRDGHYRLRVRIDPAEFPRHDRVNGRRFVAPIEVEFRDVPIVTGQP